MDKATQPRKRATKPTLLGSIRAALGGEGDPTRQGFTRLTTSFVGDPGRRKWCGIPPANMRHKRHKHNHG